MGEVVKIFAGIYYHKYMFFPKCSEDICTFELNGVLAFCRLR